jgi:transcriptional regulator with XRE-family HTH domain
MIQQPELGKRILALRKSKDVTQEELKEKCHVSVRTIQRIESGIVTPRLTTIRILIAALGENPGDWQSQSVTGNNGNIFKRILLIAAPENKLKEALQPAWIMGLVYLLLFLTSLGIGALPEGNDFDKAWIMIPIYVLMMATFTGFIRGFVALARLFEIHQLKISSYLSLTFVLFTLMLDIIENGVAEAAEFAGVISFFSLIMIGATSLIFGMALLKLQDGMGRLAKYAGRLEIIFGLSYLSIILSFIGMIIVGPLLILEIVLLSKADQQVNSGDL